MVRFVAIALLSLLAFLTMLAATLGEPGWWGLFVVLVLLVVLGVYDLLQRRHNVLRNYPILGHMRFLFEGIRPEIQQYFVERNYDGRPYDRDVRSIVYARAKGESGEQAFGTERELSAAGHEFLIHSAHPASMTPDPPRVRIGGPECTQPYDMALLNVSAMSFGALSAHAIRALNEGAAIGGFAHDTGEGGISEHHLHGGDLVWEIGSGYFGARDENGRFDPERFAANATRPEVKCVSLKLSQGAKPGIGGVLPGPKVTPEIAAARGVPVGVTCISPPAHAEFSTPRELIRFVARMRELSGGKPAGFKLCVGSRREVLALCKAMIEEGTAPDFIIVDGSEGGTGAAPLEYEDHVGMPLTDGLIILQNALVGTGLRDRVKIGASGKVATGFDVVKRLAQGADFTNAARAMMFAVGCIQAQRCHTNTCPVGVATQDKRRMRALDVGDKRQRVANYQRATVASAMSLIASMGLEHTDELEPRMLHRRMGETTISNYADIFTWLESGQLLTDPPETWAADWYSADPDRFAP